MLGRIIAHVFRAILSEFHGLLKCLFIKFGFHGGRLSRRAGSITRIYFICVYAPIHLDMLVIRY